ncbi:hypothetical protein HH214_15580 [Mucilaginibacter robiniae]|uniref:Uncharacterized protein n=1 Tax=Mucilaginibacter robiniae TaxID=2728022 RepID=A0A7L5E1C9_9SPHI|nr:hypothetical protein [Mucilaginibacter robiniae]QJD97190.1 hypothetical protein HH214_15580 [Mucilaginibacter robiniae]
MLLYKLRIGPLITGIIYSQSKFTLPWREGSGQKSNFLSDFNEVQFRIESIEKIALPGQYYDKTIDTGL